MKKDAEVKLLLKERKKGRIQEVAAARSGMSVRTARKYEKAGRWHKPYSTYEEALSAARSTGQPVVSDCGYCAPRRGQ